MRKPQNMMSTGENVSDSHLERKALKRPDSFTVAVSGFFADLLQNTRGLIMILGVMIAAGVALSWYSNQRDTVSHQAMDIFYQAEKLLEQESKKAFPQEAGAQDPSTKKSESHAFLSIDVDSKFPQAIAKLREVSDRFPKARAGFEARMQLGSLYFDHGQFEKALGWFIKAESSGSEKVDRAAALSSLGYAQESLGKPSEALASFQKAISVGEVSMKGDLLLAIARCYESIHDLAKARSIYDQVSKEFPGGDYSKTAELLKSRI